MKIFRFLVSFIITAALITTLNTPIAGVPPLGNFLSPFHGFLQNAEKEGVNFREEITFKELSKPVTIYYDEMMVPHIYAENEKDLRFVQGYVTARDRLWQMDFLSRVVFGRISEVIGERALGFDRLQRRTGLKFITERLYRKASGNPEMMSMLQAYSDGVNAYIEQLSYADYPLEFKLLNYSPERWSPLKSCMAYAMLSNTLSRSEADLENTNALELFGRELFDILYPDQLGNLDPVIPKGTGWNFVPLQVEKPVNESTQAVSATTPETIDKPNPLNGSNSFVVSGQKTKSGHVLLANEPDLELTMPSIWYAYHLHSPKQNVMGVTVPGTPVVLIGFNDSIAWGVTNSPRDQVDWYSVEFRDHRRKEYRYNGQWFKTEKVVEEILIKGDEVFYDTIIHVHHGPVVYDRSFKGDNEKAGYAMKWVAHQPASTLKAMLDINRADNYSEFVEALKDFTGPPQNFTFGSSDGTIALHLPGRFPVKWEEQGKFLMDGSSPEYEWKKYIPFAHHLHIKNPEQGFLSSANQHPVDQLYPYYIYDHHYEFYRNRRINDRLRVLNNIVPEDMMRLQNDNFNYRAFESLPMMLDSLDTASFTQQEWVFYNRLKEWDYFNLPDLKAPSQYELWWDLLYQKIWDEFDTISVEMDRPDVFTTIYLLKNRPELKVFDILDTEYREYPTELYNITFKQSLDSLETWKEKHGEDYAWFKFKNTRIKHLIGLAPFSFDEIRIGGNNSIVNAAGKKHGPSWRMIVELDPEGTKAWGIYPGSQTGNPGNPMYGHMIEKWASGTYNQLLFGQDISKSKRIIFTQTAQPAR